jgi:prevent-host-death family protein
MKTWPVQDAKAKFSEMLDLCVTSGAQIVTRRGLETAVLVPIEEWQRLRQNAKPSLYEALMSDEGRFEMEIPSRKNWTMTRRPLNLE